MAALAQVLVPGVYAWVVTVVPAAASRAHPVLPRLTAFAAFVALLAGVAVVRSRPRLGHGLGVWGFVGLSLLTWLLNSPALSVERLDAVRAMAGSLGWMLFALGWGTPWRGSHPEENPRSQLFPKLEPRRDPLLRMPACVVLTALGALACLTFGWRVKDPSRALLVHGVAVAASVWLVSIGADVALGQGNARTFPTTRQRLSIGLPWLLAIVALGVIAAVVLSVR